MNRRDRDSSAALAMLARRLAHKGLVLLPVGAAVATAWAASPGQPARPPMAQAAPPRRWSLGELGQPFEPMALAGLDTVLPGTIDLSSLNGSNGFQINGISAGDYASRSVSGAGDIDGDGFADMVIGARYADPHGSYSGQSYVVYGGTGLSGTLDLSALNGTNGFRLNGVSTGDISGFSVSGAGDVNGDGLDDILIGAFGADPHGGFSGQSYVVYGGTALTGTVDLSALNGVNGFYLNGISASDQSGYSVSNAGDVNGDGYDDVVIGALFADPHGSNSGQSYVVFGGTGIPATVELSALNGANGFRISGISTNDYSARTVSNAGDVNADGFDDLVIGADHADPHGSTSGQTYVVYGGSGVPATIDLSALNGANGFTMNGIATNDYAGWWVAGGGDVNGDGFDDVISGAHRAIGFAGQSYVVYGGSAIPATVEFCSLNGANGFMVNGIVAGDFSGGSVSNAGDVNSDGFDDVMIGALYADPHGLSSGQGYVIYGGSAVPGTIFLSALNGSNGFFLNGISTGDSAGFSISSAGDVDVDGYDDILISALWADPHGSGSGQTYLVYGDGNIPPTPTPMSTATATATSTPTATPTSTGTPTATSTPTATPTATATSTATATPTATPTATATASPSPTITPTPTVTPTPTQPRGDCNADDAVNAADVTGLVLEIFDGDGSNPSAAPGGSYPGDQHGCNANADSVIDAGDLSCLTRLIFGSGGCAN